MRIQYIDLNETSRSYKPAAACIGYFDGLHLGHQALIKKTIELAHEHQCESALITFDPDPWVTIHKDMTVKHITTMKQRINLAMQSGIKNIYILKFTEEMSKLSPHDFVERVILPCNIKALVCGFDFRYGFKGQGTCDTLRQEGLFDVAVVDAVMDSGEKISSTRISSLIEAGEVDEAARLMGHPYVIEGKVIHGRHVGASLGFPTANIDVDLEYLEPKHGVYACRAYIKGIPYPAMANLGHNPTVNYTSALSLEVHILDFEGDLYGETLAVEFVKFIRDEQNFKNRTNLIMQLELDRNTVRKLLNAEK